jgi:hypothetical protein
MNLTLELVFICATDEEARSLESALAPDNKSVPKDQTFSSELEGRSLRFRIDSPRASSCISSAIGILADARLFQEVWALTA